MNLSEEYKDTRRMVWRYVLLVCAFILLCVMFYPVPVSQSPREFKPFWKYVMR